MAEFSADATRVALADAGDTMDDANFEVGRAGPAWGALPEAQACYAACDHHCACPTCLAQPGMLAVRSCAWQPPWLTAHAPPLRSPTQMRHSGGAPQMAPDGLRKADEGHLPVRAHCRCCCAATHARSRRGRAARAQLSTANSAILRLTKELAWAEEVLRAMGGLYSGARGFHDRVFDNDMNIAVAATRQARRTPGARSAPLAMRRAP